MLARTNHILHPSGVILDTPILVPSFSSKGAAFRDVDTDSQTGRRRISKMDDEMQKCSELLTETVLVSAYDLHYDYLPSFRDVQFLPELVFIDSGGYETNSEYELSTVVSYLHEPKAWTEKQLHETLAAWPSYASAVFVNFDSPNRYEAVPAQIAEAHRFFKDYPHQLHDVLLKPEMQGEPLNIEPMLREPLALADFDIIGFTEKELGNSMLERMVKIARIRTALDAVGIKAPLHVFGGLDPLSSSLYFIAGAEVFDGLTWLRYSYRDGTAMYTLNYGAIRYGTDQPDESLRARSLLDNIACLQQLRRTMREYAKTGDFSVFGSHADLLERAHSALSRELRAHTEGGRG